MFRAFSDTSHTPARVRVPARGHALVRVRVPFRVRTLVPACVLATAGVLILGMVREQTGTPGFLVGLGLAVLPVPPLMAAFRWLGVRARPWPQLVFCFAWGACAAALIAIVANSFATRWIAAATADPYDADQIGSIAIAPVVEETAKAAALLLVHLFRRRRAGGIADGLALAGFTATGFAFTENILYLGNAFGQDLDSGTSVPDSLTAATFFVRIVMSPFAHPLFTALTGIGFALAATAGRRGGDDGPSAERPAGRRGRRLLPLLGLALAMAVHALWNSSSELGEHGFHLVYGTVMVPAFALLVWFAVRVRRATGPPAAALADPGQAADAGAPGPPAAVRRSGPCPAATPADPGPPRPSAPPGAGARP